MAKHFKDTFTPAQLKLHQKIRSNGEHLHERVLAFLKLHEQLHNEPLAQRSLFEDLEAAAKDAKASIQNHKFLQGDA